MPSLSFELFWSAQAVKAKVQELGHNLGEWRIMDSTSTSSSSAASDTPMARRDLENNAGPHDLRKGSLVRVWKVPIPVRKGHVTSDMFKNLAAMMTLLCIAQFVYLQHLRSGLIRVANDPYDIRFSEYDHITKDSPEIWFSDRQDFIRSQYPVPVHSHNDYWRRIPLFEALGSGCISVEADVHLKNDELYVAHTGMSMMMGRKETLRRMYLEPLEKILRERNLNRENANDWRGIYDPAPKQTVVLLVDHKTSGPETLATLIKQLQPLRDLDLLTYWDGTERVMRPLTIVATGNALLSSILTLNDTHRDTFFDAPLDRLMHISDNYTTDPPTFTYNASNSYFASTKWHLAKLWAWHPELNSTDGISGPDSPWKEDYESSQLEQATRRGLVTRYWDTPDGPPNLVDIVWRVLVERKVGLINMDDLGAVRARARGWGRIEL